MVQIGDDRPPALPVDLSPRDDNPPETTNPPLGRVYLNWWRPISRMPCYEPSVITGMVVGRGQPLGRPDHHTHILIFDQLVRTS